MTANEIKSVEALLEQIKCLQVEKEALIAGQETLQKALAEKNAKIDRLIKYDEERDIRLHGKLTAIARTEAVEQLSKKIESRLAKNTDISNEQYQSIIWDISEACKEMVGDTK